MPRGHSCTLCQQRKVRCDQQKPCANCVKARAECRVVPPAPPKRAKKHQVQELKARLQRYEALLSQHGIDFPSDRSEDGSSAARRHGSRPRSSPCPDTRARSPGSLGYSQEYRSLETIIQDSSRRESERPAIHGTFDVMYSSADGFPLAVGSVSTPITDAHPPTVQIFQLWQTYLSNVDPLVKVIHVPTFQAQMVGASADLTRVPKALEALMFAVYYIAVVSLADKEVSDMFGESKTTLLIRYHRTTQQALVNADFMRSNELTVLQAYLLYLLSVRRVVDPRSLFCLTGIAVRVATRMGLHQDDVRSGRSPFEVEQRRRLWWQIVTLDTRIAEMTGSANTVLSSHSIDCSLPLNINDTDLRPSVKSPPTPHLGATEMLFSLARAALTRGAAPSGIQLQADPQAAISDRAQGIDGCCAHIESVYLRHCRPDIPSHLFTLLLIRLLLCRLRVVDFMAREGPSNDRDDGERDQVFIAAIQMLEYSTAICANKDLVGFRWYAQMHVPMPGCLFVASELRRRTTGELCERAWQAVCDYQNSWDMFCNMQSPLHLAIANMLLVAWDGHLEAARREDRTLRTPELVALLRQRLRERPPGCQGTKDMSAFTSAAETGSTETSHRPGEQARESTHSGFWTGPEEDGDVTWLHLADYEEMNWPLQYGMFDTLGGLPL